MTNTNPELSPENVLHVIVTNKARLDADKNYGIYINEKNQLQIFHKKNVESNTAWVNFLTNDQAQIIYDRLISELKQSWILAHETKLAKTNEYGQNTP